MKEVNGERCKNAIIVETAVWIRRALLLVTASLPLRCPSSTATMLGSASSGSNRQPSAECVGSWHTTHVEVARDGSIEDKDRVLVLVNDNIGVLLASSGEDVTRRQDDRVSDVADPASKTIAILLCQLFLPNCFAVAL